MDTDIKMSVKATDTKAQYDNKAKQLLGHKIILAHILVNTVAEFKGMKDGLSQIIVNVEAQKAEPSSYDILNRAIFYVSRMIFFTERQRLCKI